VPSLCGSVLAGYCLVYTQEIRLLSFSTLFVFNLLASFGLGLGLMPTTFFSLLAGYVFGWHSLPFLFISYSIATAFGYWFCGLFDQGKMIRLLNEKYPVETMIHKLSGSGIILSSLCRLSPIPFAILNAIFAITKFPFPKYMTGSLLGMVPRTIFLVYVGHEFTHVTSIADLESNASTWVVIILAFVSFAGIGWLVKKNLF